MVKSRGPLKGLRVIELGQWVLAPYIGWLMADMGAEVIKVENYPAGGDPSRGILTKGIYASANFNYYFELYNRNKQSLAIDLKSNKGKEILYQLVKISDAFVTNLRPRALKNLGATYQKLRKYNNALIYVAGSGWGPKGPDIDKASYAVTAWARAGLLSISGEPGCPPNEPPLGALDHVAAIQGTVGLLLALYHREKTGQGQRVDISLLGAGIAVGSQHFQETLAIGYDLPPRCRNSRVNPLMNFYETQDNRWLYLQGLQTDRHWGELSDALELPALKNDPRFGSHIQRLENSKVIIEILDKAFSRRPLSEWKERLNVTEIPWTSINTINETINDPQVKANEYVVSVSHPILEQFKTVGININLNKTPGTIGEVAPLLGQHNGRILRKLLNYSSRETEQLRVENVIL